MTQRKACRYKHEIYIHRLFQGKSLNMANNESKILLKTFILLSSENIFAEIISL